MVDTLKTTGQVMDALGGNGPVELLTASKPSTVSNWRGFETFPSNTYVTMIHALHALGKTAPASLWGMKAVSSDSERESAA